MSQSRPRLSVVYATYNEAKNLPKSVKNLRAIADELIVVDGQSPDGTAEIAKKLGATVISTTNKPIFHINKQMAIDAAKGDWILQMDADEAVDDEMLEDIKRILAMDDDQNPIMGYWMRRKNWYLGRFLMKGGQYPDPTIRLYRRGKAHLPMKDVHEQAEVEGETAYLKGNLMHYNSVTFEDALRKANTYTTLTAKEMQKKKVPVNRWSLLHYCFWMPVKTFFLIYFRHKGFMDGVAGFVFAVMSGLHHVVAYLKYWEMKTVVGE